MFSLEVFLVKIRFKTGIPGRDMLGLAVVRSRLELFLMVKILVLFDFKMFLSKIESFETIVYLSLLALLFRILTYFLF